MKAKIITKRYGKEYEYSIDMNDAHKAWYLFYNPTARAVFNNGSLGLRGEDVVSVEIDPVGTMGWNPTHRMDSDDWNEVRGKQLDYRLRNTLSAANQVSQDCLPEDLRKPLDQLLEEKYSYLINSGERRGGGITSIGKLLENRT